MRIFAYPLLWLIDGFWWTLDGWNSQSRKRPLTKEIIREMRRLYPEIAEELIAQEAAKRGFARGAKKEAKRPRSYDEFMALVHRVDKLLEKRAAE